MATIIVRNLPNTVHHALRVQAAHHGHSTEAEVRRILGACVKPAKHVKLGSLLNSIACEAGGLTNTEAESFEQLRDKTLAEPIEFE